MKNKEKGKIKKIIGIFFILLLLIFVIFILFNDKIKVSEKKEDRKVLENPLKKIILKNTDERGEINKEKVIQAGLEEFNEEYINYILLSSGVGSLHKSIIGGNPAIELVIDGELWSSKIDDGFLITEQSQIDSEDFRITISKEEIVKALLSPNPQDYLRNSLNSGNIQAELVAGKVELLSKGYLDMYNKLKE